MPKGVKGQGSRDKVFAVVLVGGKGKRLRPLSNDSRPKAFLSITKSHKTMFRVTVDRIKKIIPAADILVSANRAHSRLVKKDFLGLRRENLILEPVSRNTAPAIGLTALHLKKRFRDGVMVIIPADQYIIDEKKYLDSIKKGIEFAKGRDCLVVLGLKPTYPATGFGYVKISAKSGSASGGKNEKLKMKNKDIYKVQRFVEKPDLQTAKRYIREGKYLWNAGAFIFSTNSILRAIREFAPEIFGLLMQIDKTNIDRLYRRFPDISIDYAVMEKAPNLYCVKGTYRWRDIGCFEVLKEVLKRESREFVEKGGKVIRII